MEGKLTQALPKILIPYRLNELFYYTNIHNMKISNPYRFKERFSSPGMMNKQYYSLIPCNFNEIPFWIPVLKDLPMIQRNCMAIFSSTYPPCLTFGLRLTLINDVTVS